MVCPHSTSAGPVSYTHLGDALLTIINDILDFSKIEAGRMDIERQPFDLRDCVESALDLVASRAAEKHLDIAYIFEGEVPAGVLGDVTRLRQILLNLLSNAVTVSYTHLDVYKRQAYGRFHDTDRDLLGMLAQQAAVALENARWAEALEAEVQLRTAEARAAQAAAEQRAAELAVINSIQQGIAGSLDFQGIVELVGAKLREVMKSDDLGITWIEHETRTVRSLYVVEHGQRLQIPDAVYARDEKGEARWRRILAMRSPKAVSYTHLDVYKRQLQDRGRQARYRERAVRRARVCWLGGGVGQAQGR